MNGKTKRKGQIDVEIRCRAEVQPSVLNPRLKLWLSQIPNKMVEITSSCTRSEKVLRNRAVVKPRPFTIEKDVLRALIDFLEALASKTWAFWARCSEGLEPLKDQ